MIGALGAKTIQDVIDAGHFGRFAWRSVLTSARSCASRRTYPLVWTQMNLIGVRSVPGHHDYRRLRGDDAGGAGL